MQRVKILGESQRQYAHELIEQVPIGWNITFSEPKRTEEQNKKMHAMIRDFCRANVTGRNLDEATMKALLLHEFGAEVDWVSSLNGDDIIPVFRESTTNFGIKKGSEFIEFLYAIGAQYGVEFHEGEKFNIN